MFRGCLKRNVKIWGGWFLAKSSRTDDNFFNNPGLNY